MMVWHRARLAGIKLNARRVAPSKMVGLVTANVPLGLHRPVTTLSTEYWIYGLTALITERRDATQRIGSHQ